MECQSLHFKGPALQLVIITHSPRLQSHAETEAQLRDTIDLLRARLHGQTQREVENQRRLQQHTRLEPLFERLAEAFTFQSPEAVLDRLELLEDDKMGTFDQLLSAQVGAVGNQSVGGLDRGQGAALSPRSCPSSFLLA